MSNTTPSLEETNRILVKLRPSASLGAAESRANLRPLYDTPPVEAGGFGLDSTPQWFIAELPGGVKNPWDLAHGRVAEQLGIAESDVIFAEPDLVHNTFKLPNAGVPAQGFAAAGPCTSDPQDGGHGKAIGPGDAWHLGDAFTQLEKARDAVRPFTAPRTRIAHLDTGYYRAHAAVPANVLRSLERSFVDGDPDQNSAENLFNDPFLPDNIDHGTGTIGILAGGITPPVLQGIVLGGAPEAEILPLRIADSVILLRTSALAKALQYAVQTGCDVVTLSMGGWPSDAWAEAVDSAYEAGVCICAAAGNHIGFTPPHVMVYPARYPRVIGVCGVMADHKPYTKLTGTALEGSFGPDSVMEAAIAAYTPNIPWPRFKCPTEIRLNGEGTSAATPQVAAAAALWFEKYKNGLPRNWRRVEAVKNALFRSAKLKADKKHFGNGVLQAFSALGIPPDLGRPQSKKSSNSFAFLRLLTGMGIDEIHPRERMFNLEIAQRWLVNKRLQDIISDPDDTKTLEGDSLRKVMEAIIEDEDASIALRKQVAARYPVKFGKIPPAPRSKGIVPDDISTLCDVQPALRNPPYRRVRAYALDPSFSSRLDTAEINEVVLKVRWEPLAKGPVGEYLAVEDIVTPGSSREGVDLDDPRLLAQDGWAPSEGNPQFRHQMVYAVAMKTIEHFERALGRPVLWRPRPNPANSLDDREFVQQLSARPHALSQDNAFYSPHEVALLFGYFRASPDDPGDHMPGSPVYSCLSHDIIAHETTHAILDGMHRRFNEPTNPDVLALHEGFADIVALMQHFAIPEVLENEISRSRGDLETETVLGSLAVQFGSARGKRGALRNAIGKIENGVWKRFEPDPADLQKRLTPHSRGAVLVGAVFDAFLAIYKRRTADLLRIYTGGTGILSGGAIHPDLVRRLADEAAKSATHVLNMCIRALDYLPPVDVTFFEYLRALITADADFVRDDRLNYRVAFVEAFRRRGIFAQDPTVPDTPDTFSVDALIWQGVDLSGFPRKLRDKIWAQYEGVLKQLRQYADACIYIEDRKELFDKTRVQRIQLRKQLAKAFAAVPEFAKELGLDPTLGSFEVHALRRAMRTDDNGKTVPQVIVALTQTRKIRKKGMPDYFFRGGSTLVVDLARDKIKYRIVKNINNGPRRERTDVFVHEAAGDPLRALFFGPDRNEPFAALHALADDMS